MRFLFVLTSPSFWAWAGLSSRRALVLLLLLACSTFLSELPLAPPLKMEIEVFCLLAAPVLLTSLMHIWMCTWVLELVWEAFFARNTIKLLVIRRRDHITIDFSYLKSHKLWTFQLNWHWKTRLTSAKSWRYGSNNAPQFSSVTVVALEIVTSCRAYSNKQIEKMGSL